MARLSAMQHLSEEPQGGYGQDAPVEITFQDGAKASTTLGSDVEDLISEFLAEGGQIASFSQPILPFKPLSRPAFLFMLNKIGMSVATVNALIGAMPDSTELEQDAKLLAQLVFDETTTFQRDNALLNQLTTAAGLTEVQVDAAWRQGEQITW